jgi:hypothetical protein
MLGKLLALNIARAVSSPGLEMDSKVVVNIAPRALTIFL